MARDRRPPARRAVHTGFALVREGAARLAAALNRWTGMAAVEGSEPEPPGVAAWWVLGIALGWAAIVALVLVGVEAYTASQVQRSSPSQDIHAFPEPRLQTDTAGDLARLQAVQRRRLEGYGWVDRTQGLVHVPIEAAMAAVVARGSNAFAPLESPSADTTPRDRAANAAQRAAGERMP